MNKLFLAILVLSSAPTLSFAGDDQIITESFTAVINVTPTAAEPDLHMPSRIAIHTMTDAKVLISHDDSQKFSVTLNAATTSDSDENKLAKKTADLQNFVQNVKYKFADDGGLEVKAKASGLYHCSYSMTNGVYEYVKGTCMSTIVVNLPSNIDIPVTYSN